MLIAIIGAGFAGLAAAKHLRDFGHQVTVFEKCPDVGGVWSRTRRYPGLCTQNNKDTYYLSDLPMPDSYPEWPSGAQVQAYLEGYATLFGLRPHLRLATEVVSVEESEPGSSQRQPGDTRWRVTTRHDGAETSEDFDFVVVANGIFSTPAIPDWPGRTEFEAAGGRVCAPSEVQSVDEVRGRDLVVVGYGKSACDVAVSLSEGAATTTVVARQLLWKMPRMLMGVLNFKHLMLTRLGEALFEYQHLRGIEKFMHGRGKPVTTSMLGSVQQVATRQLNLHRLGLVPEGSFERIARSTVSLVTEGFYEKVESGDLRVVRDATITALTVDDGMPAATLSTGETVPAEVIVCATGFRQEVPFLSPELQQRITDDRGNFELYRQILPHEVPGIAFCGYNSSFFSPLSAEAAAIWIGAHLMGELELPPVDERRRLVTERLRWMAERTEGHHARGTNIIPFSMHNVDEILSDIGLDVTPAVRVGQWLRPPAASDYRDIPQRLIARHARRAGAKLEPAGASDRPGDQAAATRQTAGAGRQ
ncbi:monooxygenase [Enemella evansiae]|uniref:flavin-containing monooxygenase n=1 Tax=Enemella evansiae TaxID=2016499 RepID=UPI000B9713CC|nr:NAD(P)/FAD-dependent oxidoreductase [Enemella evansiae]OYO11016.1 monooxygenase [Enemella evansiae]